jgi:hypothetical protein
MCAVHGCRATSDRDVLSARQHYRAMQRMATDGGVLARSAAVGLFVCSKTLYDWHDREALDDGIMAASLSQSASKLRGRDAAAHGRGANEPQLTGGEVPLLQLLSVANTARLPGVLHQCVVRQCCVSRSRGA